MKLTIYDVGTSFFLVKDRLNRVEMLREKPYLGSIIKKLGVRKVRVGKYRLLYSLDEDKKIIILLTVFPRKKGYKRFR